VLIAAGTPAETTTSFADVDEAIAAMAWPEVSERAPGERPRLGMAPLERPETWPSLQAWMSGSPVVRAPTGPPPAPSRELELLGEQVYVNYCAACHGRRGRGDGPRASMLSLRPRDFTRAKFRFRSTASGEPPATGDLFRTVSGGLYDTPMPSFGDIPEAQRWAVVAYVRGLAGLRERDAINPVLVPPLPRDLDTAHRLTRGRHRYRELGCANCHGADGAGDGPRAQELRSDSGRPAPPRDFRRQLLKRGDDASSLYLTLITGLDGTAMPSYAIVPTDDLWSLVAFVRSLHPTAGSRSP